MCAPFWSEPRSTKQSRRASEQLVADAHDLLDARHPHPRETDRDGGRTRLDVVAEHASSRTASSSYLPIACTEAKPSGRRRGCRILVSLRLSRGSAVNPILARVWRLVWRLHNRQGKATAATRRVPRLYGHGSNRTDEIDESLRRPDAVAIGSRPERSRSDGEAFGLRIQIEHSDEAATAVDIGRGEMREVPVRHPADARARAEIEVDVDPSMDSLRLYLRSIGRVPLLSAEEEVAWPSGSSAATWRQAAHGRGEPAPGRVDRQGLHRAGTDVPGPDPGGFARA